MGTDNQQNRMQLFQKQAVRTHWDEEKELWYFSVVDVVAILTEAKDFQGARNYWKVLKHRLLQEGNETVTNCNRLKMLAKDGKMHKSVDGMDNHFNTFMQGDFG